MKALTDAGFKTKVKKAYSDSVPSGTVISTSPEGGTSRPRAARVTLTVSKGRAGRGRARASSGSQRDDAEQQLISRRAAGRRDRAGDDQTRPERCWSRIRRPGTSVHKGATVKLTVAKARPEVPDVTTDNPTSRRRRTTLEEAGYKVQDARPAAAHAERWSGA